MIRPLLANTFARLAAWLAGPRKGLPAALTHPAWSTAPTLDVYGRLRSPTPTELLAELKNTAWTCASINAATAASFPPRLFVVTGAGQPAPKCLTKALRPADEQRLRTAPHLAAYTKGARRLEEVAEHPLLDLLRQVNPVHNSLDLF
jgi:hypothetical protein